MPRERRGGSIPLSPTSGGAPGDPTGGPRRPPALYFPGDADHHDPRPKVHDRARGRGPAERLTAAIDDAVRRLSRQTRVPGFRPGKAPRPVLERHLGPSVILDEAVEHLVEDTYREAVIEQDILPLTNPDVEVVKAEEGSPLAFKATVQVRPEVDARRLQAVQLQPRDRDDRRCPCRPGPRGAARPERDADRGRGSRRAGRRLRGHLVHRIARRRAVRGRVVRADAADPRPGAAHPGLRGQPRRARGRRLDRVRHHLPRRLPGDGAGRRSRRISRSSCASCARRSCPTSTPTSSARSATSPTSMPCGPTSRRGSSATPSTGRATGSPTGSSSTRSRTRRSSCRTSWSTRRSR